VYPVKELTVEVTLVIAFDELTLVVLVLTLVVGRLSLLVLVVLLTEDDVVLAAAELELELELDVVADVAEVLVGVVADPEVTEAELVVDVAVVVTLPPVVVVPTVVVTLHRHPSRQPGARSQPRARHHPRAQSPQTRHALDPIRRLGRVVRDVRQMRRDVVPAVRAHRVPRVAVVAHDGCVLIERGEHGAVARDGPLDGGAGEDVVGLGGGVADVAEDEDAHNSS
jgi:hypothetical protein